MLVRALHAVASLSRVQSRMRDLPEYSPHHADEEQPEKGLDPPKYRALPEQGRHYTPSSTAVGELMVLVY